MGTIRVSGLGKAYKRYPSRLSRLLDWLLPFGKTRHQLIWVLQDVTLNIERGEAVGIIGVNGAGKSTLLKLITGTTQATAGTVEVRGRVAALLELGMGFHPDFTGRQNVYMSGQLMGMRIEEIDALMSSIEAFADIGEYIDQPLRVYSSGMQVRLAFSVATAVRPSILIVDEALAVGDVFFQQKCFERIRAYCEAGTTLLFVSHAMGALYSLCNRAILIDAGRIALDASPREVIDLYNAKFLHRREGGQASMKVVESKPAESEDPAVVAAPASAPSVDLAPIGPMKMDAIGSYGKPGVTIQAIDICVDGSAVGAVISDTPASIRVQVAFSEAFQDPHVGFQIRNPRGEAVFMTNTHCMRRTVGPVQSGETLIVEFAFHAGLAPGEYTITAGVAEGGMGEGLFRESLARLQDARAFAVLKNMDAILWTGMYNLDPICTVHRLSA